jgi:hypothetical protein
LMSIDNLFDDLMSIDNLFCTGEQYTGSTLT